MRIEILSEANDDLLKGYYFYERQGPNLGDYFLDSLYSDIDSLLVYAGIHPLVYGRHRSLSKRFPMPSTTASRLGRFASTRCWIAGEALPGLEGG
jgi:hypothetical protein